MKNINAIEQVLFLIIIFFISCNQNGDENLESHFLNNKDQFEKLNEHVEQKYISNKRYKSWSRIIIYGCAQMNNPYKSYKNSICDDSLLKKFINLNLSTIFIEKIRTWCDTTRTFTQIQYYISSNKYPPKYVCYDYCDQISPDKYISNDYIRNQIDKNWSIVFDGEN